MCFKDDFGSDEDNDFGEEGEDGGSDYDDKKAKKGKKAKVEKPGKKSLKRKRGGGETWTDKKNKTLFLLEFSCIKHEAADVKL